MVNITLPANVPETASAVWNETIDKWGRLVSLRSNDGSLDVNNIKAFCKRPKILGLFDRTEQSYDQTRFMVMLKRGDFPNGVDKFDRVRWDGIDHAVISFTEVELGSIIFGYRLLVKG